MKNNKPSLLLCTITLLSLSTAVIAATENSVALFLEPTTEAPAIRQVPSSASVVNRGTPVLDDILRQEGWYWNYARGQYTGFVSTSSLNKQLLPAPGTRIFLRPDENSPILGTISDPEADAVTVETIDNGWAKISFQQEVPVYFKKSTTNRTAPQLPTAKSPQTTPETLDLSPVEELPLATQPLPLQQSNPATANIPRYFSGTLKKHTSRIPWSPGSDCQLQLINKTGSRICLIDTQKMISAVSPQNYLNKPVIIEGVAMTEHGTRPLIIQATTIRPAP